MKHKLSGWIVYFWCSDFLKMAPGCRNCRSFCMCNVYCITKFICSKICWLTAQNISYAEYAVDWTILGSITGRVKRNRGLQDAHTNFGAHHSQSNGNAKLTALLHLLPSVRMFGGVPLILTYTFMACIRIIAYYTYLTTPHNILRRWTVYLQFEVPMWCLHEMCVWKFIFLFSEVLDLCTEYIMLDYCCDLTV
jgi:hypothetical protein